MAPPKCNFHSVLCLLLFCLPANIVAPANGLQQKHQEMWLNHGGDKFNRRFAYLEHKINPHTAPNLRLKWRFFIGKDITATPAIFKGTLYFPSWNGNIYAIKQSDGSLVWKQNLKQLTGLNTTVILQNVNNEIVSRSTPTIVHDADLLIVTIYGPAVAIALRRSTGKMLWLTHLDRHPFAVIAMSGTYYKGGYYVGVSSLEEGEEGCCIFRGNFAKLDSQTGKILWRTYMLPDNTGKTGQYSGASVWGSSPSIDPHRNHVYIATGNLYSAPSRIYECQLRNKQNINNQTFLPPPSSSCFEPENHSNSILALDLDSGNISWYRQLGGYDLVLDLVSGGPYEFGEAPMMLTIVNGDRSRQDIVVAVQKTGIAWALDRHNGNLLWSTQAGPGSNTGGGIWGAATDEARVYTNIANSSGRNFSLIPSNNNKTTTTGGGWVAMDAKNGKIEWSTPNPTNEEAYGPVSVANGVVFGGSSDKDGYIYAINAKSGKILWSYKTGATVYGGMSVSDGCVYVGHGYNVAYGFTLNFTTGVSLFAFCV